MKKQMVVFLIVAISLGAAPGAFAEYSQDSLDPTVSPMESDFAQEGNAVAEVKDAPVSGEAPAVSAGGADSSVTTKKTEKAGIADGETLQAKKKTKKDKKKVKKEKNPEEGKKPESGKKSEKSAVKKTPVKKSSTGNEGVSTQRTKKKKKD